MSTRGNWQTTATTALRGARSPRGRDLPAGQRPFVPSPGNPCARSVSDAAGRGVVWQARGGDRLREVSVSVDKAIARDRELRTTATARPWHEDGSGTRLRLVGPLPRSTIVVDPYRPNPQDARLLLHRVNTYEELENEIERLRAWLRDVRARLDTAPSRATNLPAEDFESLARDLRAGITAALGDRRVGAGLASAARDRSQRRG
jgi:hypothetical protein